jgi:hypothetical protein
LLVIREGSYVVEILRELSESELVAVAGGLGVSTAGGGSNSSSSASGFQIGALQTVSQTPPNVNNATALLTIWAAISSAS